MQISELSSYEEVFFEQKKHNNFIENQYESDLMASPYSRFNCNKNLEIWRILQSVMGPSAAAKNLTVSIYDILARQSQGYIFIDAFDMLKASEAACEDTLSRINFFLFMITCLNSSTPILFDRLPMVIGKYSSSINTKIFAHKMDKESLIESSLAGVTLELISFLDYFVGASDTINIFPIYTVNTMETENEYRNIREILVKISSVRNIFEKFLQKTELQKACDLNQYAHLFDFKEFVCKIRHYNCDIRMFTGNDCFLLYVFTNP